MSDKPDNEEVKKEESPKKNEVNDNKNTQNEKTESGNKDTAQTSKNEVNNDEELPSAKLLLAVAQKENDYEIDRKKTFETRSAVFIAFAGVIITMITRIMDSNYFDNVQPSDFLSYALKFGFLLLFPCILLFIALYCLINVMIPKSYKRFDLKGFDKLASKRTEEKSALFLMEKYRDVVNHNSKVNSKKSIYFIIGVVTIAVATLLVGIMTFIVFA